MRDYVLAGEVAALLNLDTKQSPWAVWNRMTSEDQAQDIGERGRWQGRLAGEIARGIAKDHDLKIEAMLAPEANNGIMPPRAWKLAPSIRTGGKPAVLIVQQRTQQMMFGWKSPDGIPEKQAMRLYAAAIAHGAEHVIMGVLVDGYRSEIYHLELTAEIEASITHAVADMIRAAREDDEPVVDYDLDRTAIRSGNAPTKAKASLQQIRSLITERDTIASELNRLKGEARPHETRKDTINTMLIHMIEQSGPIDLGNQMVSVEDSKGKRTLKVTVKALEAESLF